MTTLGPLCASPALFNSLDPKSIAEALAYYELYPETKEGRSALQRAANLLHAPDPSHVTVLLPFINRLKGVQNEMSEQEIGAIEALASHLPNRKLKGFFAKNEGEVLILPEEEVDLGKALILSQLDEGGELQARAYSALLDLMALQILARLPKDATPLQKIQETNRFIFDEMHFKFPPQSVYTENIDRYTFLSSVMDNHLGVCLGVTALYLAIAQRIELPLEIVTPPGHIYVRYRMGEKTLNIETTARGVHMPDETYLSVQNSTLQQRSIREVVGMTHFNQASTYLYKGEYQKAMCAYEKARRYTEEDPLVKELLGLSYLFTEREEEGRDLLKQIGKGQHAIAEDYLAGKVDLDGIATIFMLVDESRDSILAKQKKLKLVLEKYPEFRDGWHQLAITWIQLNHAKEAIQALTRYDALDASDPLIAYYLAILHGQRQDYKNCWRYLKRAETLTAAENPKTLRDLRQKLVHLCPE